MVIIAEYTYTRPSTVAQAVAALTEAGPDARLLAGGTDLVPWLRDDVVAPAAVVDLKGIPGLDAIRLDGDRLHIGALVTINDLALSDTVRGRFPLLVEMAHVFASNGIRNRATLVGNLCSAVPSCDGGPPALVLDGVLHTAGPDGEREILVTDWFVGPRHTALRTGELVTGLSLSAPVGHAGAFAKLARYRGEDLAQASIAVRLDPDGDVRVAFGAVGPTPLRSTRIEEVLAGSGPTGDAIDRAVALVAEEISPITDIRASAEYREHMSRVMLARALGAARSRLAGDGPPYPTTFV